MISLTFWFNAYSVISVFISTILVERISGLREGFVFNFIPLTHDCAFNWNNGLKKIIVYIMSVVPNHKCALDSSAGFKIQILSTTIRDLDTTYLG